MKKRVRVSPLNSLHSVLKRCTDVLGAGPHVIPVAAIGDLEAVLVCKRLTVFFEHSLTLFVPDVVYSLEEKQRQDVALPVGAINRRATQDVGDVVGV